MSKPQQPLLANTDGSVVDKQPLLIPPSTWSFGRGRFAEKGEAGHDALA